MTLLKANCPSCAGPIEFTAGATVVVVCPFCRSAVARTDRGYEDLGKVSEVADSRSPLRLGLKGNFKGNRFELTGRAQLRHDMGGFWDEWYATFSNGWVGWLAEAQGKFYLTFYQPMPDGATVPAFDRLELGSVVSEIPNETPLIVIEKGTATPVAADGEIPYRLSPNEQSKYADLSGANNAFGTIDYSTDPPWVFVGQQVTLAEIGLKSAEPATRESRRTTAGVMSCPNCAGPLTLAVPDRTERVTCPNCDSLLEVNRGNLKYLRTLAPPADEPNFAITIGSEGTFKDGTRFKVIGAMVRSVTIEGTKYFWHEYLLYEPSIGFRWLVHSDDHWNFVEPINAADVLASENILGAKSARYNGRKFRIFQDASAIVEYVKGEFYWRVEQGETVRAVDYIAAPLMLSQETSPSEINWSVGVYQSHAVIENAFGLKSLPRPSSVAPNQPFGGSFYYTWGLLPIMALFGFGILLLPFTGLKRTVYTDTITIPPTATDAAPQVVFSKPFELGARRNVRITASAPVSNSAADLDVDLVNDQNDEVESVVIPVSYYEGVEGGETWTEGDRTTDRTLSSLPGGQYTLRAEATVEGTQAPLPITITVDQSVNRGVNFFIALLVLAIVPIINVFRKFTFESRRWSESMFGSSGDSGDDE
ncbi:MAG: DUF4178 domain-containing protein [Pyrinomonadaceae bacterium]